MHAALYVSKTGLSAHDKQLTTISNNLSNASTVGYKRDRAVFEDLLYQVQRQPGAQTTQDNQLPSGLQLGTGVRWWVLKNNLPPAVCRLRINRWMWPSMDAVSCRFCARTALFPTPVTASCI